MQFEDVAIMEDTTMLEASECKNSILCNIDVHVCDFVFLEPPPPHPRTNALVRRLNHFPVDSVVIQSAMLFQALSMI